MPSAARSWYRAVLLVGCAVLVGCGLRGAGGNPDLRDKRRRCGLPRAAAVAPESTAVRCAEWFVARNGYTDLPVADTAAVVPESIELEQSRAERLAGRRGSIAGRAAAVCRSQIRGSPGYTVGFAYAGAADTAEGRAVTMDTAFQGLRVEHVGYRLTVMRADTLRCRALGG